ncbi:MAG: hypothetical protein EBT92_02200 [Planctomycetes bacterium]|nr:hypothetical protein [Planctomycetota bacterium]
MIFDRIAKALFFKKAGLTLCLCMLILGCGIAEYEEQAYKTLEIVAEADEADKLLGYPVEVPEPKDANGTVLTKHTFLRLPRENYSRPYPDFIRGKGVVFIKYGKQKGSSVIPREVFLAYSDETEGGVFKDGVLEHFEAKAEKKKLPGLKIKDDVKTDQYYFTNSSSETIHLFLALDEKVAVIFKYDLDKPQVKKQEVVSERSMRTFRLNGNADLSKAQWDLKQQHEGGDKKP